MDRFIDYLEDSIISGKNYLKSNMDRFIGLGVRLRSLLSSDLKSNMDRFIDGVIYSV